LKASRDHVKRNRRTAAAAKIKDTRTPLKQAKEAFDMGLIDPTGGTAIRVP
jgi:hypothetical protein